jgi:hypothetical protein
MDGLPRTAPAGSAGPARLDLKEAIFALEYEVSAASLAGLAAAPEK